VQFNNKPFAGTGSPAVASLIGVVAAIVACLFLVLPWCPLGVPSEWAWTRHAIPSDLMELADRLFMPVLSGALFFVVARAGERRILRARKVSEAGLLLVLVLTGLFWFRNVQQAAPSPHREVKQLWVNYDRYASGYFLEAAFKIPSAEVLLTGYEARMREGDVLHVGTHPPGLFLLSLATLHLTKTSPGLVRVLEAIRPKEHESLFRQLELSTHFERPLTAEELAALQLLALLSLLAPPLTLLPLYFLTRTLSDRRTAWQVACLFLTVPTIAVFCPKSDVIYPLTMTTFLWLGTTAVLAERLIPQLLWSAAAALCLSGCLLLSLAHLPAVVVLVGFVFLRNLNRSRRNWIVSFRGGLLLLSFLLVIIFVSSLLTRCNLFVVWKLNLTNHSRFYDQSTRTWWIWLLVNIVELAFAVGLPLFLTAAAGSIAVVRNAGSMISRLRQPPETSAAFIAACLLTGLVLWISGKNSGEAARLWCFLTPWLAIATMGWFRNAAAESVNSVDGGRSPQAALGARDDSSTGWSRLLLLQLIVAVITVGTVNGYMSI
jgi:methylthioxylose transferase